ncbi:hypothetical protein BBO99_00001386 [Phytophthora kernoviae]|uniref:GAF domain-containing protein n=2 Tax=Phytophthora kernoviae TaxID=325452 RepID=A0A3R7K6H1_9STRA|nr:hypothetical protein G195_002197 [Phytophthora kernoviae 00238/432]KAG2526506.1 hypothetical protein JM18_004341 [Phytophthora kernoviae]KAG2530572.1 hypothetical protein JM16_000874 [Phytophthora kernoviae]RLN26187.1 hypothetical protein BBI17_001255 [Phytophthora kernoviae]RLN84321.1 hypothetical protein BBO99_00001386 [Phytophthora kernoviae]
MAADDFRVLHLVDSADWVADHERTLCYVCTRPFGTFRRKHHCRMSPGSASPQSVAATEASRLWLQSHLHSPSSGPSSDRDSEENQLLHSMTPKPRQLKLRDGHFNSEGESKNLKSSDNQSLQPEQPEQTDNQLSEWSHPWPRPPVGTDEENRLRALYALNVLESPPEKPFDMICDLAKARLSCPMAAVSFLDEHCQWFKASVGLAHKMIPRKIAFCAYTVFMREPLIVLDTLQDPRFRTNPLVSGAAGVRFYAAAPIVDPNSGYVIGSVFVLDTRPREACDIAILERLAIAAGENLPQLSGVEMATPTVIVPSITKRKVNSDNSVRITTAFKCSPVDCSEPRTFDGQKIEALSPATTASTVSTSSIPSIKISNSPSERSNNNIETTANSTSTELTQLSMGTTSAGENMEVLLMRLLTQNTETQQQLADQQISLSTKLGQHTDQINKLMSNFARMEAKVEAKVDSKAK